MEDPVARTISSPFIEVNPVKVLFIKLCSTPSIFTSTYTPWPTISLNSPARFIAAEIEASNDFQLLTLNNVQSPDAIASKKIQPIEAIFFVIPKEFEDSSGQASNLQSWLETLKERDDFKEARQFFLVNRVPSIFGSPDFSPKIQRVKNNAARKEEVVPVLQNGLDIIYCEYPDHKILSDRSIPIDQSIVYGQSEIVKVLDLHFAQRFASSERQAPKPKPLKRTVEIVFYGTFLFLSTVGVVILVGAIMGGASGAWIDIISDTSSWIFDVNLLNNAIEAVFNGLGTTWSLGVVISAFLIAGLVTAAVVSWGLYDYFHPEILPGVVIDGNDWTEVAVRFDSNSLNQKNLELTPSNAATPSQLTSSRGLSPGSREDA